MSRSTRRHDGRQAAAGRAASTRPGSGLTRPADSSTRPSRVAPRARGSSRIRAPGPHLYTGFGPRAVLYLAIGPESRTSKRGPRWSSRTSSRTATPSGSTNPRPSPRRPSAICWRWSRYSVSAINLQPWKIKVVSDQATKEQLLPGQLQPAPDHGLLPPPRPVRRYRLSRHHRQARCRHRRDRRPRRDAGLRHRHGHRRRRPHDPRAAAAVVQGAGLHRPRQRP